MMPNMTAVGHFDVRCCSCSIRMHCCRATAVLRSIPEEITTGYPLAPLSWPMGDKPHNKYYLFQQRRVLPGT
jgi:hypothetical protein